MKRLPYMLMLSILLSSCASEHEGAADAVAAANDFGVKLLLMAMVGLMVLMQAAILVLYQRNRVIKRKLAEANSTIRGLRELGSHKDQAFKKNLLKELNIVSGVQLLGAYLSDDARKRGKEVIERVNEIVAGHNGLDWERLYRMCNFRHDNLLGKMQKNFPDLDELQLKICCLTLEELNNDQQAFVLQRSKGYVQNNKSAIRKIIQADPQRDLRAALLKLKDTIE